MQSSQLEIFKERQSINYKANKKIAEFLIKQEQNEQNKPHNMKILQKYQKDKDTGDLLQLIPSSIFSTIVKKKQLLDAYLDSFEKLTQKQQYKGFKQQKSKIADFLIDIQDKIEINHYQANYHRALILRKQTQKWSKEFIIDWSKAAEEQKKSIQQRNQRRQSNQNTKNKDIKSLPLSQSVSSLVPSQNNLAQSNALPEKSFNLSKTMKSPEKAVEKKTGEKKIKKDETSQKIQKQKQKKAEKQNQQENDSNSSSNQGMGKQAAQKKNEQEAREKIQRFEKPHQSRDRVKAFMQYLLTRKDFYYFSPNQSKLKQLAQFLNQNLQKFMKHHLTNLIEIAKLRNVKHVSLPSSGNQFTYFSKEGCKTLKPIHLQDPVKMLKINYKSKFQLYSILRLREEQLQEALQKYYIGKKSQSKTVDKKLWEYLLRPSHVVQKNEQFIELEEAKTDRLSIEISHIRYLFQSHKFIRNSWLMMNCYNS